MKDQHEKIKGYRDLCQEEIDLMNEIKQMASNVEVLVEKMKHMNYKESAVDPELRPNPRWLAIGSTDLQTGFMALVRSVAKPTSF